MNSNLKSLLHRSKDYGKNYDRIFRRKDSKGTADTDIIEMETSNSSGRDDIRGGNNKREFKNVEEK
jgi:hypothetical protein